MLSCAYLQLNNSFSFIEIEQYYLSPKLIGLAIHFFLFLQRLQNVQIQGKETIFF
jgi:hypothetical protein